MRVVIVEDEKATANDLKRTLQSIEPSIDVVAILSSVEEGIAYLRTAPQIDLFFSDIQLGDGLSFEIFEEVAPNAPVVFCTAYDNYLFEAFQASGIDYILKPFTRASLQKALEKYQLLERKFSTKQPDYAQLLQILQANEQPRKRAVIVRVRDKIIPLQSEDIAIVYVDNGGTFAYTFAQEKYLLNETLDELEASFAPSFFRANRQFLVNRKAVRDASQHFNRKLAVNLTLPFKETILIGKMKTTSFLEWLSYR